jgi:hypothetical protein
MRISGRISHNRWQRKNLKTGVVTVFTAKGSENDGICAEAYSPMPHKRLRRTCHVFSVIDAEILEKGHLWTETGSQIQTLRRPPGMVRKFGISGIEICRASQRSQAECSSV